MTCEELEEILQFPCEDCIGYSYDDICEVCNAIKYYKEVIKVIDNFNQYKWHDLRKNPDDLPPVETEVDIVCERKTYKGDKRHIRTNGMYEDGNVHTEDSKWCWIDIDCYGTYCEETDDYIIPEGWWEYRHYNPDEVFNNAIDDRVIAWRFIEPFEEVEA